MIVSDPKKAPQVSAGSTPVKKSGFMSTTLGKVVTIVIGLCVLSVVIGIAAAVVLYFVLGPADVATGPTNNGAVVTAPETTGSAEATTATEAKPAEPAAELPNKAVFTFRDIFDPLILPLPEESNDTTDTDSNDNTSTPTSDDTLYLQNITTIDGILHAVLLLDGETYTLSAGEGIPGTPWEVLSVGSSSVTMLYGDIQVVLAIGQGINK